MASSAAEKRAADRQHVSGVERCRSRGRCLLPAHSAAGDGDDDDGNEEHPVVSAGAVGLEHLDHQVAALLATEAGELLVDIHGQHAWQSLTRPQSVRALLDRYGPVWEREEPGVLRIEVELAGPALGVEEGVREQLEKAVAMIASAASTALV